MNPFPRNTAEIEDQQEQERQILEMLKSNPQLMKKYQEELTKMQGKQRGGRIVQQPMTSKQYNQKVKEGNIEQSLD